MIETRPLRVVTADDSATVRLMLKQTLSAEHGFEVAGEAKNGRECVQLVTRLGPDMVGRDVDMRARDGVEPPPPISQPSPPPILISPSSARARRSRVPIEALAAGALDVLAKPGPDGEPFGGAQAEALRAA